MATRHAIWLDISDTSSCVWVCWCRCSASQSSKPVRTISCGRFRSDIQCTYAHLFVGTPIWLDDEQIPSPFAVFSPSGLSQHQRRATNFDLGVWDLRGMVVWYYGDGFRYLIVSGACHVPLFSNPFHPLTITIPIPYIVIIPTLCSWIIPRRVKSLISSALSGVPATIIHCLTHRLSIQHRPSCFTPGTLSMHLQPQIDRTKHAEYMLFHLIGVCTSIHPGTWNNWFRLLWVLQFRHPLAHSNENQH